MAGKFGAMLGMSLTETIGHQSFNGASEQLLALISEQSFGLRVHQNDPALLIGDHHGVGSGLEQSAELSFGSLFFGDVLDQRSDAENATALIDEGSVVPLTGNDLAAPGDVVVRTGTLPAFFFEQLAPEAIDSGAHVRRHNEVGVLPNGFLTRVAEDALGGGVPGGNAKIEIPFDHGQRSVFDVDAKPLLGLAELLLGALSGGDVSGDTEHADHLAVRIAVGTFGGEKSPAHACCGSDLFVGSSLAGLENPAVPLHNGTTGAGSENLNVVSSHNFFWREPDESGGCGINEDVAALPIFDEYCVSSALGDALQEGQILLQFLGIQQELSLHNEQTSAGRCERNHDQQDRPVELLARDAQDEGKDERRDQERGEFSKKLQASGLRLHCGRVFSFIPGARNENQKTVGKRPGEIGPASLHVMTRGLIVEGSVQNERMYTEERSHASEIRALQAVPADQCANRKAENDEPEKQHARMQCAHLHGLPSGLPARWHVDFGELDSEGQGADLYEIEDAQPLISAAGIARTQEQRHYNRNDPEEDEDIAGPECAERLVKVIVIVGVEPLTEACQQSGECSEAPNATAEGPSAAGSLPANHRRDERRQCVNPIAPE